MRAAVPADTGGPASIEEVFDAEWLGMLRLAVLLVDDRASAEDVVQEAFAGLHRHWGELAGPERAGAYLRRAVINGARSTLRRRRTARAWRAPHAVPTASAEEEALLGEQRREVLAAVQALPPRQREVVVLRYWSHIGEAETAEALGISRGTVKSTTSRALRAVEKALESTEEKR